MLLGLNSFLAEGSNNLSRTVLTDEELDGVIGEVATLSTDDPKRQAFNRRLKKAATASKSGIVASANLTPKAEFEKRAHQLPANIRELIAANRLRVVDAAFYTAKAMNALLQLELMANADTKAAAVTNINNRKLESNQWFLCTHIQLLSAVNADPKEGAYALAADSVLNGEFELRLGSKIIVPKVSCTVFNTTNQGNCRRGMWQLPNPKWLAPETEIIPELKLPAATAANTAIMIVMYGVSLEKA